ncbi:uncharacterized protein [Henckelia pumila]|uniref:uncharacterized protein n=1 Tax=Henckelia pumila TaxID=405737 RepID=UPI003C6DF311
MWKSIIHFTIKALDERAWKRILNGWTPPKMLGPEGNYILKPETAWSTEEILISSFNAKALNAIFSTVDMRMYGIIVDCTVEKDAWEALQEHCEGSESVKRTKIRLLNSQFENLRMEETETISEYDHRLCQISTEAYCLGGPIANEGLCELNSSTQKKDKGKSIALQVSNESYDDVVNLTQDLSKSDLGDESISLLTKKFNTYLKKMQDNKEAGQRQKQLALPSPVKNQIHSSMQDKQVSKFKSYPKNIKAIKCHECIGFGHYANECPTRLKKGLIASLSDEEYEEEQAGSDFEECIALTSAIPVRTDLQINPHKVSTEKVISELL